MEQILIHNLSDGTRTVLRQRANEHSTSIKAEARAALFSGMASEPPSLVELISTKSDSETEFDLQRSWAESAHCRALIQRLLAKIISVLDRPD